MLPLTAKTWYLISFHLSCLLPANTTFWQNWELLLCKHFHYWNKISTNAKCEFLVKISKYFAMFVGHFNSFTPYLLSLITLAYLSFTSVKLFLQTTCLLIMFLISIQWIVQTKQAELSEHFYIMKKRNTWTCKDKEESDLERKDCKTMSVFHLY